MPRPPSAILPTPWRRPLMANIMQSQAVQQQLRVQGGLKQPISSQHTHAVPSRTKNLAQTSDGKYHAVSSSPTASPCPKQSQTAQQQPHVHAVPSRTKTWRRPLMVNIMQPQAAHQQPHVHAVHPAQKPGADL